MIYADISDKVRTKLLEAKLAQEKVNRLVMDINELYMQEGRCSDPGTISTRIIKEAIEGLARHEHVDDALSFLNDEIR